MGWCSGRGMRGGPRVHGGASLCRDGRLPPRRTVRTASAPARWCLARRRRGGVRAGGWCRARRKRAASAPAGGAVRAGSGRLPHRRVVPYAPEAGGFRTGGWCCARRKRAASAPAGRAPDAETTGGRPARWYRARRNGRLPHRRVVFRAGAAGGRTGAVPWAPVRVGPVPAVVLFGSVRAGPRRGGAGRAGPVAAVPAWSYAGENRWSLMRRAAPMTPAVGPSSPRTMGRLPVARGSDPR